MKEKTTRIRAKLRLLVEQRCATPIKSRFDYSDVVQEGMLQLCADKNSDPCDDTAWLTKIGTGHFCKLQRFNLAQKRSVKSEESPSSQPGIATDKHLETCTVALLKHLEELDAECKHAIIRRFYDNASYNQIAKELNTTPYGAKTICGEGIKILQVQLSELGGLLDG